MNHLRSYWIAIATGALLATTSAQAQTYGPGTTVTSDTDVLNTGTTAFAFSFNLADNATIGPVTVNGVTFTGMNPSNGIDFTFTNSGSTAGNGVNGNGSGLSANLNAVLQNIHYNNFDSLPSTLTLTGLTAGNQYQLQLFAGTDGAADVETFQDLTQTGTNTGVLQYGTSLGGSDASFITESFTAIGTSEVLNVTSQGALIGLNAINLRDVSVPEPSTYAMIGLGLLSLLAFGKFRRLNA